MACPLANLRAWQFPFVGMNFSSMPFYELISSGLLSFLCLAKWTLFGGFASPCNFKIHGVLITCPGRDLGFSYRVVDASRCKRLPVNVVAIFMDEAVHAFISHNKVIYLPNFVDFEFAFLFSFGQWRLALFERTNGSWGRCRASSSTHREAGICCIQDILLRLNA